MDRFGIANTAVNQRNKIMENRKIFIRAECAPSGTYRADRAPDGRSRSCRRSGPDGAMRFSEFRRSVEAISHRMFAAALRMSEVNGTVASPPRSMPKCRPPVEYALAPHGPGPMPRIRNLVERAGRTWRKSPRAAVRTPRRPAPPRKTTAPAKSGFPLLPAVSGPLYSGRHSAVSGGKIPEPHFRAPPHHGLIEGAGAFHPQEQGAGARSDEALSRAGGRKFSSDFHDLLRRAAAALGFRSGSSGPFSCSPRRGVPDGSGRTLPNGSGRSFPVSEGLGGRLRPHLFPCVPCGRRFLHSRRFGGFGLLYGRCRNLLRTGSAHRFHGLVQFDFEIRKHVHVVDECVVSRIVGIEVGVHVAVGEPFGRHVVEMVGMKLHT